MIAAETTCYCGSGNNFANCCEPLLSGERSAQSAKQLMRSRYSAFTVNAFDYLVATHHESARSTNERAELEIQSKQLTWWALQILDAVQTTDKQTTDKQTTTAQRAPSEECGEVEFRAWFAIGKQLHNLHERSRFVREQDRWFYVDAVFCRDERVDLGRNDLCFCSSGRKYKHCHAK